MGQSHEKFIFLGMTEVIVVEKRGLSLERVIFQYKYIIKGELN
jgi:hypothetical protein